MTQEIIVSIPNLHHPALQTALTQSLGALSIGAVTARDVQQGGMRLHLSNAAQPTDITTAQNIAAAHDPVYLSIDRTSITANGTDTATITISAPKQGAAPVTLTITVTSASGSTSNDDSVTLTNGVGTETITSLDPCTITVSVKNPSNRSTDVLTITAI